MAYEMRQSNEFTISADEWFKELNCMENYRMVLSRQLTDAKGSDVTEWGFRHEKNPRLFLLFKPSGETITIALSSI